MRFRDDTLLAESLPSSLDRASPAAAVSVFTSSMLFNALPTSNRNQPNHSSTAFITIKGESYVGIRSAPFPAR